MPFSFESEQKLIRSCLKLDKQALESALVELNQLGGKCHICIQTSQGGTYLPDLISHMRDSHAITIRTAYSRRICLCCGAQHADLAQLVQHLYDKHKVLMFSTLSKIFYVTSKQGQKTSILVPDAGQSSQQQNYISKHLGLTRDKNFTLPIVAKLSVSKLNNTKKGIFFLREINTHVSNC